MSLDPGSRVGPYEIVARIGAGGMGEVWRARDTRLDRTVAIKTLPAELAGNAQFRLRFEREAKTISQLNHPNICTLHDVGDNYLVMEYLEGETLADRIARGPLPPEEVLRYGIEIAEALDKAHRQKVVHRDLKPGNVMITKSGAKLLDFGLAKANTLDLSTDDLTQQKPLTREGTVIGTFQYMAPEQLEGAEADPRSDIFAFGALLYEMATGKRAFDAKSKTSLIAAIVTSRPAPVSSIQPIAPVALDHVVEKCLEKDPEKRWQSAHDIVTELQWIAEAGSKVTVAPFKAARRRRREVAAWALAALLAVVAGFTGRAWFREMTKEESEVRFVIPPVEGTSLNADFDLLGLALSPDGKRVVFAAVSSGRRQLYLRELSEIEPKAIPETDDGSYPFWSPDGKYVGFFADGKLKKVAASGGPAQVICDAPSGRGASWGKNGTILLAPNVYSSIYSVSAAGGTPVPVTKLGPSEVTHRWPHWIADTNYYFYLVRPKEGRGRGPGRLMVGEIGKGDAKQLMENATNTIYADGNVYFGRDQRLMVQEFDLDSLSLVGEPALAAPERISFWEAKNLVIFTIAPGGSLVYLPEESLFYDLELVTRDGKVVGKIVEGSSLNTGASFSPDGKKIAFARADGPNLREDIWIYDLDRKQETRFTFEPGLYYAMSWSPDGSQMLFGASQNALGSLFTKPLRGGAKPRQIVDSDVWKVPGNFSPDGKKVVYQAQSGEMGQDLYLLDLVSGKSEVFLQTRFSEAFARFSPDGKYIVYQSDESGRSEVYIRRSDGSPEQWQLSTGGGAGPIWAGNDEILFTALDGNVMSTAVAGEGEGIVIGTPKPLFGGTLVTSTGFYGLQDVSPDGNNLLIIRGANSSTAMFRAVVKK